jgi:hypothetical protein
MTTGEEEGIYEWEKTLRGLKKRRRSLKLKTSKRRGLARRRFEEKMSLVKTS